MPKKITTEEFISRANLKHSSKYFYERACYTGSHHKIIITCGLHGDFKQVAYQHLNGQGCPFCYKEGLPTTNKKDFSSLILNFRKVHGDKYDYSLVTYINNYTKIKIKCIKHDFVFEQEPKVHLNGSGCKKCSNEFLAETYKQTSYATLIEQATNKYGDYYTYLYDDFVYRKVISCICPLHGVFKTTPQKLLNSSACSVCHPRIYTDTIVYTRSHYQNLCNKSGSYIYLIQLEDDLESFYKIGITNDPDRRFKTFSKSYKVTVVNLKYSKDPAIVWDLEKELHKKFKDLKYKPLKIFHGSTECFLLSENIQNHINLLEI